MQKDHPPPKPGNETPFQRFRRLAQKIVAAPKDKERKPEQASS